MSQVDATIDPSKSGTPENPLRVLLVSPVGQHGGAEQVFLLLAKYLPALNVQPYLACLRPGPLTEIAERQGLCAVSALEDFGHVSNDAANQVAHSRIVFND